MVFIVDLAINTAQFTLFLEQLQDLKELLIGLQGETYWAGSALDYAIFVEKGTGPAKNAGDGNAVERISEWASDKAIPEGAAIHTILKEDGTKPHPFRKPAVDRIKAKYNDVVTDVNHEAGSQANVTIVNVDPTVFLGEGDERPIVDIADDLVNEMKSQFGSKNGPQSDTGSLQSSITHADNINELISKSSQSS